MVDKQRGTRLSTGAKLSTGGRAFAAQHGIEADEVWAEFVDYWVAVPGQRGIKLDWEATWRNRVRAQAKHKGRASGYVSPREARIYVATPRECPTEAERKRVAEKFGKLIDALGVKSDGEI